MATLYGKKENHRTQKVLATAKYGNVKVNVKEGNPPQDKFPFPSTVCFDNGKAFLSADAGILWEVAGDKLKGQNKDQESSVVCWLSCAESEFSPAILGWVLPACSMLQMDKASCDAAKSESETLLASLNGYLASTTFLVGERLSLADISLAFNLLPAYQHVLEEACRNKYQNVTRWFNTVMGQPEVKEVVGSVALCSKAASFDMNKYKQNTASAGTSDGGKKGKKDKKEGAKKEAPKKKEKEPAEELDAADLAAAEEPKKADPFAQFPKGSFNMDEFKRTYSNEDTEKVAIPYLWEKMDWENHSLWYCEYKYPEDLGLTFMSCNLMGGMFQRLEKLRKNAFASLCLFGENNNSTISGIWFWKGDKLAFELSPDWQIDYASYDWKKLDPADPKSKKMVQEYFCWEGDFDGKKFNQGKIFK